MERRLFLKLFVSVAASSAISPKLLREAEKLKYKDIKPDWLHLNGMLFQWGCSSHRGNATFPNTYAQIMTVIVCDLEYDLPVLIHRFDTMGFEASRRCAYMAVGIAGKTVTRLT